MTAGQLCRECLDYAGTDPRPVVSLARGLVHVACLAADVTPEAAASDPWAEARAHLRPRRHRRDGRPVTADWAPVAVEQFPDWDRPVTNPADSDYAEILADFPEVPAAPTVERVTAVQAARTRIRALTQAALAAAERTDHSRKPCESLAREL